MKNILISESDQDMRVALVPFLEEKYQTYVAGSDEEVFDQLRRKEIDLLIIDMEIPATKTLHLILEAEKIRPDLNVIVLYIYFDQTQDVEPLLRTAADICIRKPFDSGEVILKAIQQLEERRHSNGEYMRLPNQRVWRKRRKSNNT